MVRNGKAFGNLTTMKGWCFLQRINGGSLYITPMYADFAPRPGVSAGAVDEGYHSPNNFTIMQALYFMSRLAEGTNNLPETPINGVAGQVYLPSAPIGRSDAAPTIQQPQMPVGQGGGYGYGDVGQGDYQAVQVLGGYDQADYSQYHDGADYSLLQFEPWNRENYLGPKTWLAKVLSDDSRVVLKLWDAWKFNKEARDHEVSIYEHLRPLWGIRIPSLRVSTPIEYFSCSDSTIRQCKYHFLHLSNEEGSPVSSSNLTANAENKIIKGFESIHALGVVHGDIRAENILVSKGGDAAWIVDFEFSAMIGEGHTAKLSKTAQEMVEIKRLLMEIKNGGT